MRKSRRFRPSLLLPWPCLLRPLSRPVIVRAPATHVDGFILALCTAGAHTPLLTSLEVLPEPWPKVVTGVCLLRALESIVEARTTDRTSAEATAEQASLNAIPAPNRSPGWSHRATNHVQFRRDSSQHAPAAWWPFRLQSRVGKDSKNSMRRDITNVRGDTCASKNSPHRRPMATHWQRMPPNCLLCPPIVFLTPAVWLTSWLWSEVGRNDRKYVRRDTLPAIAKISQKQLTFQAPDNRALTELIPRLFLSGAPPFGLVHRCEVDAPTMIGLSQARCKNTEWMLRRSTLRSGCGLNRSCLGRGMYNRETRKNCGYTNM